MKNAKILAFLLAMLMLLGMLASCNNKEEPQETETSGLIESTTDLQETEPNDEVDDETEAVISMTGTTATAGSRSRAPCRPMASGWRSLPARRPRSTKWRR